MADQYESSNNNADDNYEDNYEYELFDEENQQPTINTMTSSTVESTEQVNNFDIKNDSHLNLIYRRMIAGLCFRLPNAPTCPDDIFESWMATFLTDSVEDPSGKSRAIRFAWTQERVGDFEIPIVKYFCAKNLTELINIAKESGLITRTNIRLHDNEPPSKTCWSEAMKVNIFTPVQIVKDETNGIPADIPATPQRYLLVYDAIVHYLTGGYYKTDDETAGFPTQKYFLDYEENLKVLKHAYKIGSETIVIDLLPSFKEGTYFDYKATVSAVKRRYGRGLTQETMIDWFRKLDEALNNKSPTEFKIQRLRTLISAKFITDPSKFPTCSDFEGDTIVQNYPEEFTPMIATLLHYMTLSNEIPRNDWDKVQRRFHQEIKGKVTYQSWHENRSEFYRVVDEYKSSNHSIRQCDEINAVRQGQLRPNRGRNYNRNQNISQNRTNQTRNPIYRPPQQRQVRNPIRQNPNRPNNRQTSNTDNKNRLRKLLCMSCSRWAGENKYHQGPWGGGPSSNCPYDKNGRRRPGYRFLASIFGEDVNCIQIEHYLDIESEGLEYETVNHVSDANNYLIARAMENQKGQE